MTTSRDIVRERLRDALERLAEHARRDPEDAARITIALVNHLRAWRPESVAPLSDWEPTEATRDPRGDR